MGLWVVLGIIVVAAVVAYFLFARKKGEVPALEREPEKKALTAVSRPATGVESARLAVTKREAGAAPRAVEAPTEVPQVVESKALPPEPSEVPEEAFAEEEALTVPLKVRPAAAAAAVAEAKREHVRDVQGVRKGLKKARGDEGFFGRLAKLITGRAEIDAAVADEIEEVLISSDVGVATSKTILERLRAGLSSKELADSAAVWNALRSEARRILSQGEGGLTLRAKPTVVLMVGVNGSGKTTTIGKLATQLKGEGKKVVLAAGDTFRAAAVQQLEVWGKRVGCDVVKGKDGADPGAVIFDAVQAAMAQGADVVLADTAGRLHTKTPLMDELKKIARNLSKAMDGAPHETWLVLDATNGQNAVAQSRQFAEALPLSGIVLTKLDGTAKGGVVLGICDELKVPVRYIGLGERADDLRAFDADEFVEALLGAAAADEQAA